MRSASKRWMRSCSERTKRPVTGLPSMSALRRSTANFRRDRVMSPVARNAPCVSPDRSGGLRAMRRANAARRPRSKPRRRIPVRLPPVRLPLARTCAMPGARNSRALDLPAVGREAKSPRKFCRLLPARVTWSIPRPIRIGIAIRTLCSNEARDGTQNDAGRLVPSPSAARRSRSICRADNTASRRGFAPRANSAVPVSFSARSAAP